ncbi:MAG TPA: GspH/FimT family pseudopilin [Thiopseudomonas sp.]|nr:GspH/FimT family pseudopilin [Thiopseudomonas sp.]
MHVQRAFTLIEMLIVLTLLAIFAQVATPALQDFLERNRQQALFDQVSRAIYTARTYAVTHQVQVELCASSDGVTCDQDWSQGWLLHEMDQAEPIAVTQLNHKQQLHWSGFRPRIRFNSTGISPTSNGRFYSCSKQEISWQLILNRQGRLRTANSTENSAQIARCN